MRIRARWIAPVLAMLLAGCGLIVIDESWQYPALDDAVHEAAAEINLHYAMLDGADTLADARAECDRHAVAIDEDLRHMRGHMYAMTCDPNGREGMMGLMTSLEARVARYLAEAEAATTVEAIRALARQYGDDAEQLFDRISDRADTMACYGG
jgi:hypothetical protein